MDCLQIKNDIKMRGPLKLLFICSQNRMRSPTAEHLLQGVPGYAVKSAGIDPSSSTQVNQELLAWADLIFVMERKHWLILEEEFPKALKQKQIICLHIPDEYSYMEPELIHKLKAALAKYIELPNQPEPYRD
jgi:predicted protein tyrosine phosphatase